MDSNAYDSFARHVTYSVVFNTLIYSAAILRSDPDLTAGRALLAFGFPLALATTTIGGLVVLAAVLAYEVATRSASPRPGPRGDSLAD